MQVVRIHDPARNPASWAQIIRPGQFVAFATPSDGTCVLFDSLDEARACCEAAVDRAPDVRFDVFDSDGRAQPPLLTIVHPSRAERLDTHPGRLRTRRVIAWTLVAAGIPLIVYAYWKRREIEVIGPAFIGVNMLIAAARLFWFNLGIRETEHARKTRVARIDSPRSGPP